MLARVARLSIAKGIYTTSPMFSPRPKDSIPTDGPARGATEGQPNDIMYSCGLLVLKARYMGVRARKGHHSPGTRKLPRPGYRPWRTETPWAPKWGQLY